MRPSSTGNGNSRAAQYVRMSTEHQQYSIDNQIDAIREYAEVHGYRIVKTYADPGRSGLTLKERPELGRLLADVAAGDQRYETLLIYDVSRWGRFQDSDEAAAYEFHVRSKGVQVVYCMEQFGSEQTPTNALLKHIKRSMAAEYSRELSAKVSRGKIKAARRGVWVTGHAPYGFERWAVAPDGRELRLAPGESRHVREWRTVLRLGPPEEVAFVRRLFRLFVEHERRLWQITRTLDAECWRTRRGLRWSAEAVRHILASPLYAGEVVYNRTSRPLKGNPVDNPEEDWVRVADAVPAIIDRNLFDRAQVRLALKTLRKWTDEELIAPLAVAYVRDGALTQRTITNDPFLPGRHTYLKQFGSLGAAFALAGYRSRHYPIRHESGRSLRGLRVLLTGDLRLELESCGLATVPAGPCSFALESGVTVSVVAVPQRLRADLSPRWDARMPTAFTDLVVVARARSDLAEFIDFRLVDRDRLRGVRHCAVGPKTRIDRTAGSTCDLSEIARRIGGWNPRLD
jgi:DNA invertase Pin-like site-specific DNA recombinase